MAQSAPRNVSVFARVVSDIAFSIDLRTTHDAFGDAAVVRQRQRRTGGLPREEKRGSCRALAQFQLTVTAPTEWNDARGPRYRWSGRHRTDGPTGAPDLDGNCDVVELSRVH